MLNRRLQTQPLDPSVLSKLGIENPDANTLPRPSVQATAPLQNPASLLDQWSEPVSRVSGPLPAQSVAISSALNTRLNESEAELLLDVSSKLAIARKQDPATFQVIMSALQELNTDSRGQVSFSSLNTQQQKALSDLGMTPQNTRVIFQQLYHMLLPEGQSNTSDAFKMVQSSVTHFISNLDLREHTMNQIQQQAKDLTAVQGVVSNLAANSIQALLADQVNMVYDTGLSSINSQNFDIQNGMDYTIGHIMVLSQQSPQTLQQMEGLIGKLKSEQTLQPQERQLLSQYGLNITNENKLATIDGQTLDFQAVNRLENVIYSMKDPSQEYQQVLHQSAAIIQQSGKLEEIAALALAQNTQVQNTTQTVVHQAQDLRALQTYTNQLDSQLKVAQYKADHLMGAMSATSASLPVLNAPGATFITQADPVMDLNPTFLKQWGIDIRQNGNQRQFFIQDRQVSRLEMLQHLGQLLQQQKSEISQVATTLGEKKVEVLKANAELNQSTQTLVVQTDELEDTEQVLAEEKSKLQTMEAERQALIEELKPSLKPDELAHLENDLNPAVASAITQATQKADQAEQEIQITLVTARETIQVSESLQSKVAEDIELWDLTLSESQRIIGRADQQLEELEQITQHPDAPPVLEAKIKEDKEIQEQARIAQGPNLLTDKELLAQEQKAQQTRQDQALVQKENEAAYLEQSHRSKRFDESMQESRQTRLQAQDDRQRLQEEVKVLLEDN